MSLLPTLGTDEVAERLAALLSEAPRGSVRIEPLRPGPAPARVAAVDGSSVALAESGAHLVGAYRCGVVELAHGVGAPARPEAPRVVLLSALDAAEPVRRELARHGVDGAGLPAMRPSGALDHLRTMAEHERALEAVERLPPGGLLLVDGALSARAGLPLVDRVVARARERRVDVVGVCKSTSLTVGPVPALAACRLAARGVASPAWSAELPAPPSVRGRVLVARLSAAEPRPFRFDVAAHDDAPARVLGSVAALAAHPAYPGYPSPLAMAHNAALLSEEDRVRLLRDLCDATLRRGVRLADWEAAFLDYHEVLELGA